MYWAEALANQTKDQKLRRRFTELAKELKENESEIVEEFIAAQGKPVDLGGYYKPNDVLATKAMRPSATFNAVMDSFKMN